MGKMWGDNLFTLVPPEEAFSHYKPEEAFSHYKAEDAARFYKPKELLSGLPLEEIEAYLRSVKSKQETE